MSEEFTFKLQLLYNELKIEIQNSVENVDIDSSKVGDYKVTDAYSILQQKVQKGSITIDQAYILFTKLINDNDFGEYYDDDKIKEKWNELTAHYIEDYEIEEKEYRENVFTAKQLAKMYKSIVGSSKSYNPFLRKYDISSNTQIKETLFAYLKYISNKPKIALCTLLWFDSFHDFKKERIRESKEFSLNDVVYHLTGKNIDTFYRDSFFTFINNTIIFNDDIVHTVLKPCLEDDRQGLALLLYNLSEILIKESSFEGNLLHTYMLYMFDFKFIDTNGKFNLELLLENLKVITSREILSKDIPYWCKDVDEESANFLRGTNVILPASIFDQNKSNTNKDPNYFVNTLRTVIPYANGYPFIYDYTDIGKIKIIFRGKSSYNNARCNLKLSYGEYNILNPSTSRCLEITNTNIDAPDFLIRKLYYDIKYRKNVNKSIEEISEITLFDTHPINLQGQSGFSPKLITIQIIILLCKEKQNKIRKLTCKHLDFWISLKRIGDYGQILQAKQLGIPLFTNDKMQILLSIATKTSSVFSIDGTKIIWYDGIQDVFRLNDISKNRYQESGIKRKVKYDIDKVLLEAGLQPVDDFIEKLNKAANYININEKRVFTEEIDTKYFEEGPCQQIFIDYIKGVLYPNKRLFQSNTQYYYPFTVYPNTPIINNLNLLDNHNYGETQTGINLYVYSYTNNTETKIITFQCSSNDREYYSEFVKIVLQIYLRVTLLTKDIKFVAPVCDNIESEKTKINWNISSSIYERDALYKAIYKAISDDFNLKTFIKNNPHLLPL